MPISWIDTDALMVIEVAGVQENHVNINHHFIFNGT